MSLSLSFPSCQHVTSRYFAPLVATVFLLGCTPEKAEVVVNSARVFELEVSRAIDAYEQLLVASLTTKEMTEAEKIAAVLKNAQELNREGMLSGANLAEVLEDPFADARKKISNRMSSVRLYYSEFSRALAGLPRGSFFAREEVACAEEIARRLVSTVAAFGRRVEQGPISLVVPREDSVERLRVALGKTDVEKQNAARDYLGVMQRTQELNAEVTRRSLVAVEAGMALIKALERFDTLTVAEGLALLSTTLEIAGTVDGISVKSARKRLDGIGAGMAEDKHWGPILQRPLYSADTKCAIGREATPSA